MQLRGYQAEAIESVERAWSDGMRRPLVVLPTGSGKTVVMAALCSRLVRSGFRPLILVNRDELCSQTVDKMLSFDKYLSVGIVKAEKNEINGDVTVGSVQTLSRESRLKKFASDSFDVVICDEAHFAAADSWQRILHYFGCFDNEKDTLTLGVTATAFRTDNKCLGETFDDVIFERDTQWCIERGLLVPVRAQRVKLPDLDLARVRQQNGDYADGDLGKAMAQADACPIIARAYSEHGRDANGVLRRGIIFAPTVDLAHCLTDEFRAAGIPTETVIGTTPIAERRAIYAATASGQNKVISSVGVLVYGFDLPPVEVAVMARPTRSPLIYIQAAGRVLRPSPDTGKTQALILDVVGASRIGLASPTDLGQLEVEETDEDGVVRLLEGIQRRTGLIPEAPDEIEFVEVDPFAGLRRKYTPREGQRNPWLHTVKGIPFLPGSDGKPLVFLYPEGDGWVVFVAEGRARPRPITEPRPLIAALAAARDHWGPMPNKLRGDVTDGQLAYLRDWFQVDLLPLMPVSKQDASDLINKYKTSRRLDK